MLPDNYVEVSDEIAKRLVAESPDLARKFRTFARGGPDRGSAWLSAIVAFALACFSGLAAHAGGRSGDELSAVLAGVTVLFVFFIWLCATGRNK